jgi:peptidoglycan/xylan/chitin deacetylase (PgdA/CDA1 family)
MTKTRRTTRPARRWTAGPRRLAIEATAGLNALFGPRLENAFGILTYHRVAPGFPGRPDPTWNVTPQRLRMQLSELLARGYVAWPLRRALEVHMSNKPVPRNVFVVTFDDGYECVYQHALPVLRELSVPATVFLATAYIDSSDKFPFDDWEAAGDPEVAEAWRPLTLVHCRELQATGLIELGSHTHRHNDYRRRLPELEVDLRESCEFLQCQFNNSGATFAFPFGIFDTEMSAAVRRSGLLCALTTQCELVTPASDLYGWGRFTVNDNDTGRTLAAQLAGWYSLARGAWLRVRRHGGINRTAAAENASTI